MTIRYFSLALALCVCLAGLGCDGGEGGTESGTAAAASERAAANNSFGAVSEEAHKLSFHSPKEQLLEARRKSEQLRDRLSREAVPTEMEILRSDALKLHVVRLDAALALQEARSDWEGLLKKANLDAKQAKLPLDEKRALLRDQWPEFRAADDRVIASERSYTDAGNALAAALKRVRDAEQVADK